MKLMTALKAKVNLLNCIINIELLITIKDKDWKMAEDGKDMS